MDNLNQIRIFHAVAQTRNFTRAAGVVHLTQPGISKHIRQLEEDFGVALFDRLGKKIALTQAGEILFEASQEIMASIAVAEQRIDELKGLHGGKLAVGTSFALGNYVLPGILAAFGKRYPSIEVTLELAVSEKIVEKVLANKLDLGLVNHASHDARLIIKEFATDELVVIVPSGHRWANKKRIRPEDLPKETLIVAARGAGIRAVVDERLKVLGITLEKVVDFGNIEGVKRAVEAGLGVSIQSKSMVLREISAGSLVGIRLTGMDTSIGSFYLYRKDKHVSNATKAFLAILQNEQTK
jgi:DNA-binding transcriptional LysR family regulator